MLVAEGVLGDAVAEAPRLGGRGRLVASAQLSPTGPSLFGPAQGTASDLAGHGVADPSPMLLATALLLSRGARPHTPRARRWRRASRRRCARRGGRPEVSGAGVGATTREFVDAVLGLLRERPSRHRVRAGGRAVKMTGADAILRSLEAEGVDVMFGIPGGAIMPTYDAIARGTTVRHVLARHEQGAGHMAQGYARASGPRRRRDRDLRPRRDEPRHADRRRVDGLDAARLHHRPGALDT